MPRSPGPASLLLLLIAACGPDIDTEDAYALCDWIEANDPVDCSVEECLRVQCRGDNADPSRCDPVVEASEDGIHKLVELGGEIRGKICYRDEIRPGECSDTFVNCEDDAYRF